MCRGKRPSKAMSRKWFMRCWDVGRGALGPFDPLAAPSTALTAAVNTASGVLDGTYGYVTTFVSGIPLSNGGISETGETLGSPVSASVAPVNQQDSLSAIPLGPAGTVARRIYRNTASGSASTGPFYLVTTLLNNTVQTF